MNNLKRTLSLALAGVMTLGVMTVGASAAEFTDAADIDNATAVNTMTAIKVINGRDDGSFDPTATVNRAEMATMIAKALNGGEVPNLGLASQSYFTDVTADQWFAEAVNYCASLGIIAGRGDGTFDPSGSVTGWEAAKMMLVALGYESDIFGFTGSNWNTNVDFYAESLTIGAKPADEDDAAYISLYDDVAGQRALPLTRQDAAQLIYNGMTANTISKKISGIQNGAPTYDYNFYNGSMLENNFGAKTVTGLLTNSSYDADDGVWTYTIDDKTIVSAEDYSGLFMHNVISVYQTDKKTKVNTAYAISTLNSEVIASGVVGDSTLKTKKGTIDGYAYSDEGFYVYSLNNDTALYAVNTFTIGDYNTWFDYDLIDNTGDGLVDAVVVYPNTVVEVNEVKNGKIYTDDQTFTISADDEDDIDSYTEDEIAKNDWIIVTATKWDEDGEAISWNIEELELTEATQCTAKTTGGYYTIGGKNYSMNRNGATWNVGDICYFGIVNSYVVVAVEVESVEADLTTDDIVYVYEWGTPYDTDEDDLGNGSGEYAQKVRVYYADGTTGVIAIDTLGGKNINNNEGSANKISAKGLYKYTLKNGYYRLTALDAAETLEYKKVFTNVTEIAEGGEISDGLVTFANDGIFFVTYVDSDGDTVTEVFSGKQINAWKDDVKIASAALYGTQNSKNIYELGYGVLTVVDNSNKVTTLPGGSSTTIYGVATSKTATIWDADYDNGDGTYGASFYKLTIWDGAEEKVYYKKTTDYSDTPDYGRVFSFTADENNMFVCDDASEEGASDKGYTSLTSNYAYYVSAIAGNKIWLTNNTDTNAYTLTDDTQVIYIKNVISSSGNSYNTTSAVTSGSIELGQLVDEDDESKGYYANVMAVVNDDGELEMLVVDVNGNMRGRFKDDPWVFGATK